MATNKTQDGLHIMVAASEVSSGDPVVIGSLTGVAITDTNLDGLVAVCTVGVFMLPVTGNDGGDAAVSVGDKLFWDSGLSLNDSGEYFGISLGVVGSGDTATIPVLLK